MVRELHVVTLSADGRELLLGASPGGRPTHSLVVDPRLARALRGEDPDGLVSTAARLSPRDMQARLRAGATVEEVAAEAGVPVARVERFAGPVRSEQEQVVGAAQRSVLRRSRAGRSALPLADAVAANLGVIAAARVETASWTAAREADGRWVVLLTVVVRGRVRVARWRYDAAAREVTSLDAYASQIGFVDPSAPARAASGDAPSVRTPTRAVRPPVDVAPRRKAAAAAPPTPARTAKTPRGAQGTTAATGRAPRPAKVASPKATTKTTAAAPAAATRARRVAASRVASSDAATTTELPPVGRRAAAR